MVAVNSDENFPALLEGEIGASMLPAPVGLVFVAFVGESQRDPAFQWYAFDLDVEVFAIGVCPDVEAIVVAVWPDGAEASPETFLALTFTSLRVNMAAGLVRGVSGIRHSVFSFLNFRLRPSRPSGKWIKRRLSRGFALRASRKLGATFRGSRFSA